MPPVAKDTVVALRPIRREPLAGAAPRRPLEIVEELLRRPDAAQVVRALPEQEVAYAVRELGLADSLDLLALCSTDQIRACLDIDCWKQDRLDPDRMLTWLTVLGELGAERLAQVVEALDHELLVIFLQAHLRVYDLSEGEPPEEPEGHFYYTPDRFYVVDVLTGGDGGAAVDRLLESLYRASLELGRRVLMGVRWDIGAETEEAAYRFRSGRMADLGYVDYYEALRIYQYLDPGSVRLGEGTATRPAAAQDLPSLGLYPSEVVDALREQAPLGRALVVLDPAERHLMMQHLISLVNQTLSADRVDPGESQAVRPVVGRVLGYLNMGLEYLLAGAVQPDPQAAAAVGATPTPHGKDAQGQPLARSAPEAVFAQALRSVSLSRLFRLGYSLTVQLRVLCQVLIKQGLTTLMPAPDAASLLDGTGADVVALLVEPQRPVYSGLLDRAVAQVGDAAVHERPSTGTGARPFRSLADIRRTAAVLEEIGAVDNFLLRGLGLRREVLHEAETFKDVSPRLQDIRLTDLLGTMIGNLLLQRPAALVPLRRADLGALRQAALGLGEPGPALSPAARAAVLGALKARVAERSLDEQEAQRLWPPAVDEFLGRTLERLGGGLLSLPADLRPEEADMVPAVPGLLLR